MNDDFAPFELAVKLKEKGFNKECLCYYIGEDLFYNIESPIANNQLWFSHNKFDNIWHRDNYDAPTISQVLKWLRNTYNLHVETYPCGFGMWKFLVTNITTLEERALCDKYTSSEQADLAGIEYVLDNLI